MSIQKFFIFFVSMFSFAALTLSIQAKVIVEADLLFISGENSKKIVQKQVIPDTETSVKYDSVYRINVLSDESGIINYVICTRESTVIVAVEMYRDNGNGDYDLIANKAYEVSWNAPAVFELENEKGEVLSISIKVIQK